MSIVLANGWKTIGMSYERRSSGNAENNFNANSNVVHCHLGHGYCPKEKPDYLRIRSQSGSNNIFDLVRSRYYEGSIRSLTLIVE